MSTLPAQADYLPPELLLDEDNPANDQFFDHRRDIERKIMAQSRLLTRRQTQAVKSHFAGKSNKDIAKELNRSTQTISKYVNDPRAKRLAALLQHYSHLNDGPNEELRKNVLWRIARRSEHDDPRLTISAVQELNRMNGTGQNDTQGGPQTITVVVQHNVLERGPLDG